MYAALEILLGLFGDKVNPVGAAKFLAPTGMYFFACNCNGEGMDDNRVEGCLIND